MEGIRCARFNAFPIANRTPSSVDTNRCSKWEPETGPTKKSLATLSHTLGTKYIFGSISVDIHLRVFRVVTHMNSRNPRSGTVDTAAVLPEHC